MSAASMNTTLMNLAPYAANPETSLGRHVAEPASNTRNDFQRDRDRITTPPPFAVWNTKPRCSLITKAICFVRV